MGERNWWAFSFRWRGWGAVLVLAVGWLALFSLGLLVGRSFRWDCWWGAFVCFGRALAVGGFCWRAGTLARDYFLLALGDWLVLVCGGGRLAIVACVIVGRFGCGSWVIFDWLLAWGVFALQGLGGLVIGGRFLVAWRTAFGGWFVGGWRGDYFGAVREIGGFCWSAGDIGSGAFSACFGRGGFGAWIVWRVVFVVWCVTGFGGWLARGVRLSALAVGWRGTY